MRIFSLVRNIRNWPGYLMFKLRGKRKASFTFRCGQGIRLEVPLRLLHTFKESFLDEGYLKGFPGGLFPSDPVVLDIGANVGYFSFYLLSRFPKARIYAFEPVEKNFKQLKIYQNAHPGFRLAAFQKAVAAQSGSITLFLDQGDSFTTSASIHKNPFGSDPVQ
ncbi:MAG TPA: FkbM family methyltransferase, partial [Chitinophagaceae bacterium]|nr:FkbM family methyltransferase [Chitinophagaceae bacterium]